MKVFIICPVRGASESCRNKIDSYALLLEQRGNSVHIPHRDTDQNACGFDICKQNMKAIKSADEVHIFYSGKSQGTHFDMGVSFALNKKIVVVDNEELPEGKSYQKMLTEWEKLG